MTDLGKRTIQISIALGAIVGLIGCGAEQPSDVESGMHDFGFVSTNGYASSNGFQTSNGFVTTNGFQTSNGFVTSNGFQTSNGFMTTNGFLSTNGFVTSNGLPSTSGLMTTAMGRKAVSYLIKCALSSNDSLVKADQNGNNYTFAGGLGLCPAWKTGSVSGSSTCMEAISACMMAHINTAGVHVPIWLDSNDPSIGWGVDRVNYPMQEGTFFGDLLDTGSLSNIGKPSVTGPVAYYCDGAGFPAGASGVVAGRLGANQAGSPYVNPFGVGTLCQTPTYSGAAVNVPYYTYGVGGSCPSGSTANPAGGCPDGYQQMQYPYGTNAVSWNHAITVWRNNTYTPVFDSTYQYVMSAVLTSSNPMMIDVGTSPIQQWNGSAGLSTSVFSMAANGSSWTISPLTMPGKCLDAGAGTNGTGIVMNSCNGASSQSWNIAAIPQNGAFTVTAASTGRCINVRGGNTAAGAVMEVYDCTAGWTSEQFNISATNYTGTSASSSGSTSGTNPCASYCSSPTNMSVQAFQSGNVGTGAVCYQTTFPITGFNTSNMSGRTFTVNGQNTTTLPAKVNGGYCFQATSGGNSYASFATW